MKNTEYKINDSVWVLYSSDLNDYKLPIEAKFLKKVNKKDGKYEVLIGTSKIRVNHLYEKDDCFETAIFALKTALNTLAIIKAIFSKTGSSETFLKTLDTELERIKANLTDIENS